MDALGHLLVPAGWTRTSCDHDLGHFKQWQRSRPLKSCSLRFCAPLGFTPLGVSTGGVLKPEYAAEFQQQVIASCGLHPDVPDTRAAASSGCGCSTATARNGAGVPGALRDLLCRNGLLRQLQDRGGRLHHRAVLRGRLLSAHLRRLSCDTGVVSQASLDRAADGVSGDVSPSLEVGEGRGLAPRPTQ